MKVTEELNQERACTYATLEKDHHDGAVPKLFHIPKMRSLKILLVNFENTATASA